jgi:hypothetical protein
MIDTPALRLMTTVFPSIITQETQVSDVTGGYGVSKMHDVKVVVICEECQLCHELSLTEDYTPGGGKCQHKWRKVQHVVSHATGKTIEDAQRRANIDTSEFLRLVAKRTPEFFPKFLELLLAK